MYKETQIHTFRQNSPLPRKTVNKWAWQFVVSSHVLVRALEHRALGLVSSGVKKREANRSDVEKERLHTRRDRSRAEAVKERSPCVPLSRSRSSAILAGNRLIHCLPIFSTLHKIGE